VAGALTQGLYDVSVTAVDVSGNSSSDASADELEIDLTVPDNQNTVFSADQTVQGGVAVALASASDEAEVWFVPSGALMETSIIEIDLLDPADNYFDQNGSSNSNVNVEITVDGDTVTSTELRSGAWTAGWLDLAEVYENFYYSGYDYTVRNSSWTVVEPSSGDTVLKIKRKDDSLFTAASTVSVSIVKKPGQETYTVLDQVSADDIAGPSFLTVGTDMQTADGTWALNSGKTLSAPSDQGGYKLYVVDAAGNISVASDKTLTVDNTSPTVPTVTSLITNSTRPTITGAWVKENPATDLSVLVNGNTYALVTDTSYV
jgi:hypothetical protein